MSGASIQSPKVLASTTELSLQLNSVQPKSQPILKMVEKGYFYGQREVGVIESTDENLTKEIHNLVRALNEAIKDKDLADNKRSWAKTTAFLAKGSFLGWRKAVNDLNTQKQHVATIAEKIMVVFQNHKTQLDVIHTTDEGVKLSVKNQYLTEDQTRLFKFLVEGRILFA